LELDPNVDVVVQRWQALSGKQAILDGNDRTFRSHSPRAPEGGRMNRALPRGNRGSGNAAPAGHPDVEGLCLALADWSAEPRFIERRGYAPSDANE
jgi:hypothetical protein